MQIFAHGIVFEHIIKIFLKIIIINGERNNIDSGILWDPNDSRQPNI